MNKKRMVVKYTQGIVQLENVRKIFRDLDLGTHCESAIFHLDFSLDLCFFPFFQMPRS